MKWITSCFISVLLFVFALLAAAEEKIPERSICLVIKQNFLGERELAERINLACKNLNWKTEFFDIVNSKSSGNNYDWVLTLAPGKKCLLDQPNYLVLFDPEHHYFTSNGQLQDYYSHFTGYLATYKELDASLVSIDSHKKKIYPKPWYPTVQFRPYVEVVPDRLFSFLGHWGDRSDNRRYQKLHAKLSKKNYMNFFGSPYIGKSFKKSYRGVIDHDGETVVNTISEMGVCLVLHSETHLKYGIPSGRIFEAAAASAVIISDLNPFVVEHFGDSVLYVDQTLSGENMFRQIDGYMNWIKKNPKLALEKARRSYQIFADKFILENQLLEFDQFHRAQSNTKIN